MVLSQQKMPLLLREARGRLYLVSDEYNINDRAMIKNWPIFLILQNFTPGSIVVCFFMPRYYLGHFHYFVVLVHSWPQWPSFPARRLRPLAAALGATTFEGAWAPVRSTFRRFASGMLVTELSTGVGFRH